MFEFKCISSYCADMGNRMLVKAIRDSGNVDLLIYGKHRDIDTLTLMEVSGRIKNENRKYLVVDSVSIIDRFVEIRGSFSKLSLAMLYLEIVYRSNSGLNILLDGLKSLKKWDDQLSTVYFLYKFLVGNGIFNPTRYNTDEVATLEGLVAAKGQLPKKIDTHMLAVLRRKLLEDVVSYISHPLNTLKLLRF